MTSTETEQTVRFLDFSKDQKIEAPIDIVFETVLEELGPRNEGGHGSPMPMKLEAWPGGRWFRDLGNNAGHFWGNVQVIKPPTILEICGPMFMSYPAAGHLQYRLKSEGTSTLLTLTHRAFGLLAPEHVTGVRNGWASFLERVAKAVTKR